MFYWRIGHLSDACVLTYGDRSMNMDEDPTTLDRVLRKANRRRNADAEHARLIVHGALPYYGHRPNKKHERKRVAALVRQARKQS